jgi:hypothetical protein
VTRGEARADARRAIARHAEVERRRAACSGTTAPAAGPRPGVGALPPGPAAPAPDDGGAAGYQPPVNSR